MDGNVRSVRDVLDSLGEQLKEFDNGSTHGWQELDITKDPTGKITNSQVALDPTVAAVASVAQVFGSAIGRALAPNNQLTQVLAGTLAGTVASAIGQKFGQVLSASLSDNAAKISLDGVFNNFGLNLASAGAGSVASLITAELGTALGLEGYGAKLFNAGVGGLASQVATQLVQKGGLSALHAINWTEALGGAAASLGGTVGGILGSQIVHAENEAGAIGGQLLGAVGSVIGASWAIGQSLGLVLDFVVPGIGSLIGTILGTLLGNLFGASTPHPASTHILDWDGPHYTDRFYAAVEGGKFDTSKAMADAAAGVVNSYLDAVNGAALDHGKQVMIGYQTDDPAHPYFQGYLPAVTHYEKAADAVFAAALDVLHNTEVIGGDLLLKRAHQNSVYSDSGVLAGDLQVAEDYERYLDNKEVINAMMAANPDSAFTAGWIATFARAKDLGLNHMSASDFLGGLVGYLDSMNKAGLGAEAANASVKHGSGSSVIVEVRVDNGMDVPGSLSVFADHLDIISDASGQTLQFTVDTGVNASGTLLLGPGAAGTAGHDILVGGAGSDTFHGGAGFDFIDGGAGNDTLFGEDGNDILRGGTGNDDLQGGLGNDTYIFNRGDGADTVLDDYTVTTTTTTWKTWTETRDDGTNVVLSGYVTETKTDHPNAGTDTLVFGPGISRADIAVWTSGNDLIVGVKDPAHPGALTDQITLKNWTDVNDRIEFFRFADGAALNLTDGALGPYLVPFGASLSGSSVVEKSPAGTKVGTVHGFDFAPDAVLTYAWAGSVSGAFAIDAATGAITVANGALLNYDVATSQSMVVQIADQGGHASYQPVTINLIDVPDRAPVLSVPASTIKASPGQSLQVSSWFNAGDADNDALTYYFQDGTTAANSGHFALNGTPYAQGAGFGLSAAQLSQLTFVAGAEGFPDDLSMQLSDGQAVSAVGTFHIGVNRAPVLSVPASTFTATAGQSLQVASWFSASDADNDALTYYFQDGTTAANSGHFALNGTPYAQGAGFGLSAAQLSQLTFVAGAEGFPDDLSMQLSDGQAVSAVGTFHIGVNRAPVLSVPAGTFTATAGQSLQVASWFSASDADNDALTYYFQDGTTAANSGYFALNGTPYAQGAGFGLTAAQLAQLTFVAGAEGFPDDLSMQLSDGRAVSAIGTFHVNVNRTPTDAVLSGGSVTENAPTGTHVATVTGIDPDANTTFNYSLRDPDGRFAIDASSGEVTVLYGALIDYESATSYQIAVRTADQYGLFFDKSFAINVGNANEAPADATLFGGTVREHSPNGTHVGRVIGSDPDAGDVLSYSLLSDAGGRFAIPDAASGVITVKDGTLLDYATAQSWTLTVRTADQAGLFYDRPLTVSVAAGPINNADGTSTVTLYDGADAYGWYSFTSTYNGPDGHGSLLSQLGIDDGPNNHGTGSRWQNVFDVAHTQSWDRYTATFDPAGNLLTKAVTYDDGTHSLLVNDPADTASWSSFTLHYDANWNYTSVSDIALDNTGSPPLDMGEVWSALDTLTWYANPYAVGPAPSFVLSDFNGDGKTDLLLANDATRGLYVCEMNGAQIGDNALSGTLTAGWHYGGLGDFNGDRKSDWVLLNDATHQVYVCEMDGTEFRSNGVVANVRADLGWYYKGLGDFNNDGKSDLILFNDLTHGVYICEMDGLTLHDNGATGTVEAGFAYKTLGDFNGDGKDDFLFLNDATHELKVWQMDGSELVADQNVGAIDAAAGWRFKDTADFNGDGKTDLLLLNDANNHVMIWQMNGTQAATEVDLGAAPDHFHFADKGDFNGDGKTDLMFLNDNNNGQVTLWQMNGTAIDQSKTLLSSFPSGYHYVGTGDFNGDGKTDLFFQNDDTRAVQLWQMNGTEILQNSQMAHLTDGWHMVV